MASISHLKEQMLPADVEREPMGAPDLSLLLQEPSVLGLHEAQLCFRLLAQILQVAVGGIQGLFV